MDIKQKLGMLIEYERLDAPKDKKSRAAWSMYLAQKIVNFLGARELTLLYNYPLDSLQDMRKPNIFSMVASQLLHK